MASSNGEDSLERGYLIAERFDISNGNTSITYLCVLGSYNYVDWTENLSAWPSNNGIVHSGWYNRSTMLLREYLISLLMKGQRVIIAGHSIGGAVRLLLTMNLLEVMKYESAEIISNLRCITFAAPLVMYNIVIKDMNNVF